MSRPNGAVMLVLILKGYRPEEVSRRHSGNPVFRHTRYQSGAMLPRGAPAGGPFGKVADFTSVGLFANTAA
jgi:hypothetical protein